MPDPSTQQQTADAVGILGTLSSMLQGGGSAVSIVVTLLAGFWYTGNTVLPKTIEIFDRQSQQFREELKAERATLQTAIQQMTASVDAQRQTNANVLEILAILRASNRGNLSAVPKEQH